MDPAQDAPETLSLPGGRILSFGRYGDPAGRPLYFFHGFPGSRLQALLVAEPARAAGVCLVAPDRPGFGRSTPAPDRTILSWTADVSALADHLGHACFGVAGISCGGPYALACAHDLPRRLSWCGLIAGMGPMDVPGLRAGQLPLLRMMFALARRSPALIAPLLLLDRTMFRRDAEKAVRQLAAMLTPPDRALVESDPGIARTFGASLAEAYAQGIAGAQREAQLIAQPRGFELESITLPVHLYVAGQDRNVPPAMADHMAARLPRSHVRRYPGEGHLSIVVNGFGDCLRDFLAAT